MLELDDKIHIAIVSILSLLTIIINSFYIYIIFRKTPKDLSAYAFLLLNIACVDMLSTICNFMCIERILFDDGSIVYIFLGPCTFINAQACHFLQSAHFEMLGQSVLLLLLSFICRLWLFKANYKINLDIATILERIRFGAAIIAVYTMLNIVREASNLKKKYGFPALFHAAGSYESHAISGNHTISNLRLLGTVDEIKVPWAAFVTLFCVFTCGAVAIFIMRRSLFSCLSSLNIVDRHNHRTIYHSLTAQMLLPIVYNVAICIWFLDVVGIVHSKFLQRTVLASTISFPIASPLINMYFIPPYRRYLKAVFSPSVLVKPTESSEITAPPESRF